MNQSKVIINLLLLRGLDVVDSDQTVSGSAVQELAGGAPGDGGELGGSLDLALALTDLGLDDEDGFIGITSNVPNADGLLGGGGNPLEFGVEGDVVDDGITLVDLESLVEVVDLPQLDSLVLASGGDEETGRVDGQSVDGSVVSLDAALELEKFSPDLQTSVPADRGEELVLGGGGVSDAGNPVLMVAGLRAEHVLALGVPQAELVVGSAREDLSVVVGEGDREDLRLAIGSESLDALAVLQRPQSEGVIPRRADQEVVVSGEGKVADEVAVAGEGDEGLAEGLDLVALLIGVEPPDHEGVVSSSGDQDVVVLAVAAGVASDDRADSSGVTCEESAEFILDGDVFALVHCRDL